MNPLSAWTYHRRHKRQATLLLGLTILVTVALYVLLALVWASMVEPARLSCLAYSQFSMVTSQSAERGPDPTVLSRLQANPDIARILPAIAIRVDLPGIMPGEGFQFDLLGLMEGDLPFLLERFSATPKRGRLPEPGTAELVLSEDVAKMLDLEVGDSYVAISSVFYVGMDGGVEPTTFELVGILDGDIKAGLVSLEYLNRQEQYRHFPARLLVVAHDERKAAVDAFLKAEILTLETGVLTQQILNERILNEALPGLLMLLPVVLVVATALSLVIVVVNQLANARRLPEFGILHATGRSRRWLIRRLTLETATLALAGWVLGIALAYLGLHLLRVTFFAARGHILSYPVWLPVVSSLPTPAAVVGFTYLKVRRTLTRLDPVSIVERRTLSQEPGRKRPATARASSVKPLSPATFYLRHRRRALGLIGGMTVMTLAVVLLIFALAVDAEAKEPLLGYLSRISIIRSPAIVGSLDPGVVVRVEAHPAVERVIRVAPRSHMLSVHIPPFSNAEASPFGVYAEDLAYLVELYGLELQDGHLPRPGTNEMVIPNALARNRGIQAGDVIGAPDRPAYPGAPSLPTEFVVSGVFAAPPAAEDGSGLGFFSLEFQEEQDIFPLPEFLPVIAVPKAGQKVALDDWLENELAGPDASVLTHRQQVSRLRAKVWQDMVGMAMLEAVIAVVAALGLAVLNYVFVSQRQAEFGVLHALGFSRRQLVGRVFRETAFTAGIALGLTAVLGLAGLLLLRLTLYEPRGLTFGLFNVTPWLYTLPIPIAVLAVTAGTTARMLSKLDAISIIESR